MHSWVAFALDMVTSFENTLLFINVYKGGGKRCKIEGCNTVAQAGGKCKLHGIPFFH